MQVTNRDILHDGIAVTHRKLSFSIIFTALFLIFFLDYFTSEIPVQHLYYLPIILVAVKFGRKGGLSVAFVSVLLYHLANPKLLHFQHHEGDIVQVILFLTVGIIAAKLADDANRMRLLSMTDDLTGLHNLRSFESHLAVFVSQARAGQTFLSVLVLDVDSLKAINDAYGHHAGAESVRTVGRVIAQHIPEGAVACRYGGDEFIVAIPFCSGERAAEIAEQIRSAVQEERPTLAGQFFARGALSISIGIASRIVKQDQDVLESGMELFHDADKALYNAKEMGRNRVSRHGPPARLVTTS